MRTRLRDDTAISIYLMAEVNLLTAWAPLTSTTRACWAAFVRPCRCTKLEG